MASEGIKKLKRNIFIASDVQLLLDCVKLKANVLENKKTNGITIDMKRKAWNEILETYNAAQTGGTRTLEELRNKYNNEKKAAKHALSNNAKELRATGGGSAELVVHDTFDFSSKQVKGLNNPVCSDETDNYEERQARSNEESDNEDADITLFAKDSASISTPMASTSTEVSHYRNKRMKLMTEKDNLLGLKAEGLRLDNVRRLEII